MAQDMADRSSTAFGVSLAGGKLADDGVNLSRISPGADRTALDDCVVVLEASAWAAGI